MFTRTMTLKHLPLRVWGEDFEAAAHSAQLDFVKALLFCLGGLDVGHGFGFRVWGLGVY